jgi:hypothetical protein
MRPMLPHTQAALMEMSINLLFYFIIGSFGAFLKDLYETITKKEEKIRLGEVLIGGACATFICFGLQDTWFKDLGLNLIVLITFICGILGFELFGNLTTLAKFQQLVALIIDLKNRITIAPPSGTQQPPQSSEQPDALPSPVEQSQSPPKVQEEQKK